MSLNFVGISPHPPIIVPEIGKDDTQKAAQTIQAMRKLASVFISAEIDTLIIISPHMLIYPDKFNIGGMKKNFGTFAQFDAPDIIFEYNNNLELAQKIDQTCQGQNIDTLLYNNSGEFFELDHGLMVPLYYLNKEQDSPLKVLPIAYSNLDRAKHFTFGQIIGDIIKACPERIGIVASGDLSHRLIQNQSQTSKEFDKKITNDIRENDTKNILYYDEGFVESAGECGYRSILILLGILDKIKASPEVLSYEGPFGVGYLVVNYKLSE